MIEPAEMPRISEKRSRTPEQEREAERGVCQDGQTGKTITLPDPPPASRSQIYPGGDEGDSSLPRGDKRRAGVAPRFMEAFVFGTDSRVLQTPTTSFPFRGVVKLIIKFPNTPTGKAHGCTGSFIGGKHVLTAGHCVFQSSEGGWATSIRVIPALDGEIPPFDLENAPFGDAFMVGHRSVKAWTDDADAPDYDYAVITLSKTFNLGSFGLLIPSDSLLDNTKACIIGYPGELGNPKGRQQFFTPGCSPYGLMAQNMSSSRLIRRKATVEVGSIGSSMESGRSSRSTAARCRLLSVRTTTPAHASPKPVMTSSAHGNAKMEFKARVR